MASKSRDRPAAVPIYRVRYCEDVVAFMARGYSLTAFAGEIGASRAKLMVWCDSHPLFAAAVEQGQARRARVLEDRLLAAKGANAFGAHLEALKSAAPDEWPGKKPAKSARGDRDRPDPPAAVKLPDNGRG